jgi:hypothetical protein
VSVVNRYSKPVFVTVGNTSDEIIGLMETYKLIIRTGERVKRKGVLMPVFELTPDGQEFYEFDRIRRRLEGSSK